MTEYRMRIEPDQSPENPRQWSDSASALITIGRSNGNLGSSKDETANHTGEAYAMILNVANLGYSDDYQTLRPMSNTMKKSIGDGSYTWGDFIYDLENDDSDAKDEAWKRIIKGGVTIVEKTLTTYRDHYSVIAYMTPAMRKAEGMKPKLAERCINGELKELQQWLDGDVWGYIIEKKCEGCGSWEQTDSCWNFYGEEYVKEEGESALAYAKKNA